MCEIVFVSIDLLYRGVRAFIAMGPKCLMCMFVFLSGLDDFLGLACFIEFLTSECVIMIWYWGDFVFLLLFCDGQSVFSCLLGLCISPRARGHLIAKFEHSSGIYHLKEHRLGFQKMKLLSVYVGG